MTTMIIDYKCPKCHQICSSFTNLCTHVQHDHGLWYLERGSTSPIKSSYRQHLGSRHEPDWNISESLFKNSKLNHSELPISNPTEPLRPSYAWGEHSSISRQLQQQEKELEQIKAKLYEETHEKYTLQLQMQQLRSQFELCTAEIQKLRSELDEKNKALLNQSMSLQHHEDSQSVPQYSSFKNSLDNIERPVSKDPTHGTSTPNLKTIASRNGQIPPPPAGVSMQRSLSDSNINAASTFISNLEKLTNKLKNSLPSVEKCAMKLLEDQSSAKVPLNSTNSAVPRLQEHTVPKYFYNGVKGQRPLLNTPTFPDTISKQKFAKQRLFSQTSQKNSVKLNTQEKVANKETNFSENMKQVTSLPPKSPRPPGQKSTSTAKGKDTFSEYQGKVLGLVFYYLDTNSLLTCRSVCWSWRHIVENPQYWEFVNLSHRNVTSKLLKRLANWCTQTKSLKLQAIKMRSKKEEESVEHYLKSTRGKLEPGLEALLRSAQHTLSVLSIVSCGNLLTERSLWLAGCHCRQLTKFAYFSQFSPATPEALWSLGSGCRKLHTLIVPPLYPNQHADRFSTRCLMTISKCWPHLLVLCVGGTEVEVNGLIAIAQCCKRLEVLELDHMGEIEEAAAVAICKLGLRGLKKLFFTHTPVTPAAVLHFYSSCPNLKVLGLVLSPADYFVHPDYAPNIEEYKRKVQELQSLMKKSGLKDVLCIKVQ